MKEEKINKSKTEKTKARNQERKGELKRGRKEGDAKGESRCEGVRVPSLLQGSRAGIWASVLSLLT